MTIRTLFCHDITIVRAASTTDRYGNVVKDWANATRTDVRGRMAQRHREEIRGHQETQITDWICYLPPRTDVNGLDRLEWNGVTYEVGGHPNHAYGRALEHHVEVPCDIVEG